MKRKVKQFMNFENLAEDQLADHFKYKNLMTKIADFFEKVMVSCHLVKLPLVGNFQTLFWCN